MNVAMNRQRLPAAPHRSGWTESPMLVAFKAVVMAITAMLYLLPIATTPGLVAGIAGTLVAYPLASWLEARGLRLTTGLVGAFALGLAALWLGGWVRTSTGVWGPLGVTATIGVSDALFFGLLVIAGMAAVRLLVLRVRAFGFLEALIPIGAVIWIFAGHQNRTISEPRWFADWVLAKGWDPTEILTGLGVLAAALSVLMLVRNARATKVLLTYLLIAAAGVILFYVYDDHVIEQDVSSNGLGLTQQEQDKENQEGGEGKSDQESKDGQGGGQGGSGNGPASDNPYKDNYNSGEPSPVALVVMRDDYDNTNQGSVLYFRQRVLSRFAEGRLQPALDDSGGTIDGDVVAEFPRDDAVVATETQTREHHVEFPTTMHLMVDHPQPVALTHAERLTLTKNPNPRHFVASYDVDSLRLALPYDRLVGRESLGQEWSDTTKQHYLGHPDDPRYAALADIVLRDLDPRFYDDDMMKALMLKRYLEKNGFYTLKETHKDAADPTASFLFGSMRGYCVHFAHAAAFLLRSQGIAARVALGYAVQTHKRSGGSSLLIMSNDAHAWPEIHVAGVGWVTFDIYPEQSDQAPRPPVDRNLESMLGEIARDDETGGKSDDPDGAFQMPWREIGITALILLAALLLLAYAIKVFRRLQASMAPAGRAGMLAFRGTLDRLADMGIRRRYGESRERFAERLSGMAPSLGPLTDAHLRIALGGSNDAEAHAQVADLSRAVIREYKQNTRWWKRALGALNPVGWWFTR